MVNNSNDDAALRKSGAQTPTAGSCALEQSSHDIDHNLKMKAAGANTPPRAQAFTFLKSLY